MNYQLLQQLLTECAAYEQEHSAAEVSDLGHFARWLNLRTAGVAPESAAARLPASVPGEMPTGETLDSVISKLLVFLTRYAKWYGKKALADSPLGSLDEFVFLVSLLYEPGGLSKTELIRRTRLEKPAGMEVIRRLQVAGLVSQQGSTTDRRSTVLNLSNEGRNVVLALMERMGELSRVVSGGLSTTEKIHLAGLLEKLETHHQRVLETARELDWSGVVEAGGNFK